MHTGVSYMGHHNPDHLNTDIKVMKDLHIDDIFVAAQENDFAHFDGKLKFTPQIAIDNGIRPIVIFWGALNLFGGGRSSQFLLEFPEGCQVGIDGVRKSEGCYVNPVCVSHIKKMIDTISELGFQAYFIDEPTPLRDCYCPSCCSAFEEWYNALLVNASSSEKEMFRQRCVIEYVKNIALYCKTHHKHLETITCLMPWDNAMWEEVSRIEELDNLGTDIYWANEKNEVEEMTPILNQMDALCKKNNKIHHEWLQCWGVEKGNEQRIIEQGNILIREQPDSLYVWAYRGQIGTTETCHNPELCWHNACTILKRAKNI